jgi:hypothetical protein
MINIQAIVTNPERKVNLPEQLLRKATGEKESFDIWDYKNKYD